MAAQRKGTTKAKNPAGRPLRIGGGAKKPAAKRRNTSPAKRKNPTASRRRRTYTRNPASALANGLLVAGGSVLTVVAFDELVNRFAPSVSGILRIGVKGVVGWGIGNYLGKYLGVWATVIQGALWFSAALDIWTVYARPYFAPYLTPTQAQVVATQQVQDQSNGQLGTRLHLADGSLLDVFGDAQEATAAYA